MSGGVGGSRCAIAVTRPDPRNRHPRHPRRRPHETSKAGCVSREQEEVLLMFFWDTRRFGPSYSVVKRRCPKPIEVLCLLSM